jgi:hypothetical protein
MILWATLVMTRKASNCFRMDNLENHLKNSLYKNNQLKIRLMNLYSNIVFNSCKITNNWLLIKMENSIKDFSTQRALTPLYPIPCTIHCRIRFTKTVAEAPLTRGRWLRLAHLKMSYRWSTWMKMGEKSRCTGVAACTWIMTLR